MGVKGHDPKDTTIIAMLQNEGQEQLEKIAREVDDLNQEVLAHSTFPKAKVGDACLRRVTHFEDSGDPTSVTGQQVSIQTWTQELENLANPPLTALLLSNTNVQDGKPIGTLVGILSTTGGSRPFTFEITSDPSGAFSIENDNELTMAIEADVIDTPYSVTIKVTDGNLNELIQPFSIDVIPFSNTLSTLFDGVNENGNMGTTADMQFDGTAAFSFSVWVKRATNGTNHLIVQNLDSGLTDRGVQLTLRGDNRVRFALINNTGSNAIRFDTTETVTIADGWTHIAVTYDGTQDTSGVNIYKDAVLTTPVIVQNNLSATSASTDNWELGSTDVPGNFFDGNIDELATYDIELSGAQVTELYNSGTPISLITTTFVDPIHWWRMGDGSTHPTVNDEIATMDITLINSEPGDFVADVP